MTDDTEHNLLPEWNDLPQECREAMRTAAEFNTWPDPGWQCALDVYLALRKHMPQQQFPLFERLPQMADHQ